MKLIYIAGPYRGRGTTTNQRKMHTMYNIRRADELGKKLIPHAYPVIPHNNTAMWDFDPTLSDTPGQLWLDGTIELMRRCDGVLMTSDWMNSAGAVAERDEALRMGLPVYYSVEECINGCQ